MRLPLILAAMVLAGCASTPEPAVLGETAVLSSTGEQAPSPALTAVPSPSASQEPVTFDGYRTTEISTLDPQLADDAGSIDFVENLFVSLTSRDPESLEFVPEAATSWQVSDDGLVYTFELRPDIPWVRHDPDTGDTEQVLDEAGNPRFVTAHDFAYAIKRACDPNLGSYYSSVVAPLIKGCEAVLYADVPAHVPQLASDVVSFDEIENLFMNLTDRDPETLELVPEVAESWQVSDDGLVYTFKLRTDIPWVRHDPDTGETRQVLDEAGKPRTVTAHDFAYAIKRACDPDVGSYYSAVVAPLIKGCEEVLYAEDPAAIPPELVEAIGVRAGGRHAGHRAGVSGQLLSVDDAHVDAGGDASVGRRGARRSLDRAGQALSPTAASCCTSGSVGFAAACGATR